MYAIVKTGGKQYRVEPGQTLLVERLPEPEGATVTLEPLLVRSEEAIFDAEGLAKVSVEAKIVGHLRGKKLRVFKFKPKRGYRRRTGHRQELTRIEVTRIGAVAGAAAPKRAARRVDEPAAGSAPAVALEPAAELAGAGAAQENVGGAGQTPPTPKPRVARKPAAPKESTESVAERKPAGARKAATAEPAAARAAKSKPAAPAEPDAAPQEEHSDGS
jgi:large subunit ribosomal protein L21